MSPTGKTALIVRRASVTVLAIATVATAAACVQDGPTPYTGGPRDPDSSTVFNLSLTPASLPNGMMADPDSRCIWAGAAS